MCLDWFQRVQWGPWLERLGHSGRSAPEKEGLETSCTFLSVHWLLCTFFLYMGFRVQLFLGIGVHVADKVLHGPCGTTGATWIMRGLGCLGECLSGGLSGGLSAGLSGGQYGSAIAYASWTGLCFGQL